MTFAQFQCAPNVRGIRVRFPDFDHHLTGYGLLIDQVRSHRSHDLIFSAIRSPFSELIFRWGCGHLGMEVGEDLSQYWRDTKPVIADGGKGLMSYNPITIGASTRLSTNTLLGTKTKSKTLILYGRRGAPVTRCRPGPCLFPPCSGLVNMFCAMLSRLRLLAYTPVVVLVTHGLAYC